MIDFMVIAAPRSGTAWAANWLTTDQSLCLHDPLWENHYEELDARKPPGRLFGIACTGVALFPDWVNRHPARKVILHRDLAEIDASLAKIGAESIAGTWHGVLDRIQGTHVHWREIFEAPARLYEFLLQRPFDAARHALLRTLLIERDLDQVALNVNSAARLVQELKAVERCA